MIGTPEAGYPGSLMSTREVPAPERTGEDLLDAPFASGAAPGLEVPALDRRPTSRDGHGPVITGARRVDGDRPARSHAASRSDRKARSGRKPSAPKRQTILYEDQTRAGAEPQAVEVRKVRRVLRRVDTWSLFRFSIMLYACTMLVFLVAAVGLWIVATTAGAIPSIEHFITALFALKKFHFRSKQLFIGAVGLGLVWVFTATLFTTVTGVLYNLISDVVGGVELTVLEEEPLEIIG